MFGMDPIQLEKTLRQFLPFVSGIATALGWTWFDGLAGSVLATIGPVGGLISLVWTLFRSTRASMTSTVAALPEVKEIVLHQTQAAVELNRVTPPNVKIG